MLQLDSNTGNLEGRRAYDSLLHHLQVDNLSGCRKPRFGRHRIFDPYNVAIQSKCRLHRLFHHQHLNSLQYHHIASCKECSMPSDIYTFVGTEKRSYLLLADLIFF